MNSTNQAILITLKQTKEAITQEPDYWKIHLMNFVDSFRHYKNPEQIVEPFELNSDKMDALLASTAEYLCAELGIERPKWLRTVPAVKDPWFVSGMENLKAIALVESPVYFRIRKIFVLENFLSRA